MTKRDGDVHVPVTSDHYTLVRGVAATQSLITLGCGA
jgi:hypothetical protein